MTPYEMFLARKSFLAKNASLGGLVAGAAGLANSAATLPWLTQMAGWAGRHAGNALRLPGLARGGKWLEDASNTGLVRINQVLNKGPGIHYNLSKAPGPIRAPAQFLGMNMGPNKMTAQRALVWGGGALALKETADSLIGTAKTAAARDFDTLFKELD